MITLHFDIDSGELKDPHLNSMIETQRVMCCMKLASDKPSSWKIIMLHFLKPCSWGYPLLRFRLKRVTDKTSISLLGLFKEFCEMLSGK